MHHKGMRMQTSRIVALAAAIALHALLIKPALWSGHSAFTDLASVHYLPVPATLLFIDEAMSPLDKPPPPQVSLQVIRLAEIAAPDARTFDEAPENDEAPDAPLESKNQPAKMSIILRKHYMAQIRAQIDRVWALLPPQPTDPDASRCVARISQERNGVIAGVRLVNCGNDESRMRSLEQALFSLSPLPQPITPDLYVPELTVNIERR